MRWLIEMSPSPSTLGEVMADFQLNDSIAILSHSERENSEPYFMTHCYHHTNDCLKAPYSYREPIEHGPYARTRT